MYRINGPIEEEFNDAHKPWTESQCEKELWNNRSNDTREREREGGERERERERERGRESHYTLSLSLSSLGSCPCLLHTVSSMDDNHFYNSAFYHH